MADLQRLLERYRESDPGNAEEAARHLLIVELAETVVSLRRRVAELEDSLEHTRNTVYHPGEY